MLNTNAGFESQVSSGHYAPVQFVELFLKAGVFRSNTYGVDITTMGNLFLGLAAVNVGNIQESESGTSQKLDLTLNGVRTSNLSIALASPDTYQNRSAIVYLGMINPETGQVSGAPVKRFAGVMDTIKIDHETGEEGKSKITMTLRSGSHVDANRPDSLRLSDQQHRMKYPGDLGLEYVTGLIATPPPWLTVKFQKV